MPDLRTFFLLCTLLPVTAAGQEVKRTTTKSGAVVRNLVVPGWGHTYAGVRPGAARAFFWSDVALIAGYAGLTAHANHLQGNLAPYARQNSGAELTGRNRTYVLAVTNYTSLAAYNDEMLRRRQWNALLADTPENAWNWTSESERLRFVRMKDRYDRTRQNQPALLTLLVINRAISAISVYRRFPASIAVTLDPVTARHPSLFISVPF